DQLLREPSYPVVVSAGPPKVHPRVTAIDPTQVRKRFCERRDVSLRYGIIFVAPHVHPDPSHPPVLLRSRRERPACGRAAKKRDELAPSHSITSSARPSSVSGKVTPSALAVIMLMISSTFTACWTGRSAGLSPLRMRPT